MFCLFLTPYSRQLDDHIPRLSHIAALRINLSDSQNFRFRSFPVVSFTSLFKICQTVVCICMINQFHEFLVITNFIVFQLPVMTSMEIRVLIKVEFQCSDHPAIKFPRMFVSARASKKHLT